MKKYLCLFLLLMLPTAVAYDQIINVQDDTQQGPISYRDQTATRTYQFSLNNNFFNITDDISDNNSVWEAIIHAQIDEEGEISATNDYFISFQYNDTFELVYHTSYIRHSLGRWERIYRFDLYNGTETVASCETPEGFPVFLGGTTAPPDPWITFQYNLNGRFATAPSLYVSFGDDNQGDTTCNLPTSIGGGIQIPMGELTSPPSVVIKTLDAELYTDKLTWQFDTRQHELEDQLDFNTNVSAQGCEQNFIIFGFCNLVNGLKALIDFVFQGISWIAERVLGQIPIVGEIFKVIGIAFSIVGDMIIAFLNIYFLTGEGYGVGQIFWMHVVYSASVGAVIAAFTGNLLHILLIPGYFVYYSGKLLYLFFKFFFWTVPTKAGEYVTRLLGR